MARGHTYGRRRRSHIDPGTAAWDEVEGRAAEPPVTPTTPPRTSPRKVRKLESPQDSPLSDKGTQTSQVGEFQSEDEIQERPKSAVELTEPRSIFDVLDNVVQVPATPSRRRITGRHGLRSAFSTPEKRETTSEDFLQHLSQVQQEPPPLPPQIDQTKQRDARFASPRKPRNTYAKQRSFLESAEAAETSFAEPLFPAQAEISTIQDINELRHSGSMQRFLEHVGDLISGLKDEDLARSSLLELARTLAKDASPAQLVDLRIPAELLEAKIGQTDPMDLFLLLSNLNTTIQLPGFLWSDSEIGRLRDRLAVALTLDGPLDEALTQSHEAKPDSAAVFELLESVKQSGLISSFAGTTLSLKSIGLITCALSRCPPAAVPLADVFRVLRRDRKDTPLDERLAVSILERLCDTSAASAVVFGFDEMKEFVPALKRTFHTASDIAKTILRFGVSLVGVVPDSAAHFSSSIDWLGSAAIERLEEEDGELACLIFGLLAALLDALPKLDMSASTSDRLVNHLTTRTKGAIATTERATIGYLALLLSRLLSVKLTCPKKPIHIGLTILSEDHADLIQFSADVRERLGDFE
ncbi:hypothetical protein PYCC9005_003216 [Savitreella phatthalungensis]